MTQFRSVPALVALLAGVLPAMAGTPGAPREMGPRLVRTAPAAEDASEARVIVKYRSSSVLMQALSATSAGKSAQPLHAASMGQRLGYALQDGRVLGARTQALRGQGLASSALAARLRQQADVEWAVVDERRTIASLPNDPYYGPNQTSITPAAGQWYLRAPDSLFASAINAPAAWDITPGSASVVVAVLDTGVRYDHPDLVGKLLPGYDFVSSDTGDGGARDSDASDPGDYSATNECGRGSSASSSSWHGTQTAGLVGAATDNNIGMASVGRKVMVLPVRVLGKCGGSDSDIIAAMRWAAGISSSPVANPNPAKVISMSLGKSGSCLNSYQDVLSDLAAAGVTVVVAAGNDAGLAVSAPANCSGALAVAGLRHTGTKVGFSSVGPQVAIAAPGGNCVNSTGACLYPILTTINKGTTTPSTNGYSDSFDYSVGTSFSTPIVAGAVGLMLSANPDLTPDAIRTALQQTARPFVTTGAESGVAACHAPTSAEQLECYCTTSTCGAGMLDVGAAVAAVRPLAVEPPTASITPGNSTPTAGTSITLTASATASGGRSIAGYQWSISGGNTLATLIGSTVGSSATLSTSAAGQVTVTLLVTDTGGATGTTSSTITVQAASTTPTTPSTPTSSGGGSSGGGAVSGIWVLLLAAAAVALRRTRPPA